MEIEKRKGRRRVFNREPYRLEIVGEGTVGYGVWEEIGLCF